MPSHREISVRLRMRQYTNVNKNKTFQQMTMTINNIVRIYYTFVYDCGFQLSLHSENAHFCSLDYFHDWNFLLIVFAITIPISHI